MKKACFVIPYFGKLPECLSLFFKSCRYNIGFDWLIFTDDTESYDYPNNVRKVYISFDLLREHIQKKFDFKISLSFPYKLCDYKPAYGYLFEEYLREYEFWGYCDLDMIFGDISQFITEDIFSQYDKIGHLGHFTLYRNTVEIRNLFMKKIRGHEVYKEVYTTDRICLFDEWNYAGKYDIISINDIFRENKKKVFFETTWTDVYPNDSYMHLYFFDVLKMNGTLDYNNYMFYWEKGRIVGKWKKKGKEYRREFMYLHLQKRKMKVEAECVNSMKYYILPDRILRYDKRSDKPLYWYCTVKKIFNLKRFKYFWKERCYWVRRKSSLFKHKILTLLVSDRR